MQITCKIIHLIAKLGTALSETVAKPVNIVHLIWYEFKFKIIVEITFKLLTNRETFLEQLRGF